MDDLSDYSSWTKSPSPHPPGDARAITWRSVTLGIFGVILINALAPYNDYILVNTLLVGSFLPLVIVLVFFMLALGINAPLWKWAPRLALRQRELGVIMGMMLVACSVPTQGLMRQLIPTMVSPFHYGELDSVFWQSFLGMEMPAWLFPIQDIAHGRFNPIQTWIYRRVPPGEPIPYSAWIIPLAGWGVFVLGLWSALFCFAAIVRYQWAEQERLPFPLARVESSLIEDPAPGHSFNTLLRSRGMWAALISVVVIHSLSAMSKYDVRVPFVPLRYELGEIMANEPWSYFGGAVKNSTIYFTFIGLAYFVQARIAFSIWAIFLIRQLVIVQSRIVQVDIPAGAWADQHLGTLVAFCAGFLWIGRHHWGRVLRRMIGLRPSDHEPRGSYLPYGPAGWGFVGGIGLMIAWLLVVGVTPWVALMIVGFILLVHMTVARVIAQTGVPCFRVVPELRQIYYNLPVSSMTPKDVFFAGAFTFQGAHPTRESLAVFALHGMEQFESTAPSRAQRHGLITLMIAALVLSYVVSAGAWLKVYYTWSMPTSPQAAEVENEHGLEYWPRDFIVYPVDRHVAGQFPPISHNPWLHWGIGAGVTTVLQVLSLRFAGWMLSPVGYLVSGTWYGEIMWFSIFLGWAAKVLIVRFGGAKLFQQSRGVFMGLIIGEALAAAIWMVVTLVLAQMGVAYETIQVLPK